jgi:YD repeat-containing protein
VELWRRPFGQHPLEPDAHLHLVWHLPGQPDGAIQPGSRRQSAQITVLNSPPPTTTVTSYTYDELYRLTRAAYSSGEWLEYEYDAVGNRTAQTRPLNQRVYLPIVLRNN